MVFCLGTVANFIYGRWLFSGGGDGSVDGGVTGVQNIYTACVKSINEVLFGIL